MVNIMNLEGKKVKIGLFKRIRNGLMVFAARLQKQFFYDKTATFTVTKLHEALVKNAVEAYGLKEGLNKVYRAGEELGHEFMMELSTHLIKDLKASPAYAKAAWETFAGHKLSHIEYKEVEINGYKCQALIFSDKDCPWCKDISFETHFCAFPAGAYNGASATWAVLTKTPVKIFVRETKCKAIGDPYCEWTYLVVPEDMPLEVLKEAHPEWFEVIEEGFFEF